MCRDVLVDAQRNVHGGGDSNKHYEIGIATPLRAQFLADINR